VNDDLPDLERLGRVDPPDPRVLDAARETLWSAVAAEMLSTAPRGAPDAGTARLDAAHAGGEPAAGRNAEEPAREPRRADPGPS
jgi:hypothetical protein